MSSPRSVTEKRDAVGRLVLEPGPTQEEINRRLDEDFQRWMAEGELPVKKTIILHDTQDLLRRLVWLNEGPDSLKTIDDTITSTSESSYIYGPYTLWSASFFNNAAAGGANVFCRFTTSVGRTGQVKIPPQSSTRIAEIRGALGDQFRLITDTGSAEVIGVITLKWPQAP